MNNTSFAIILLIFFVVLGAYLISRLFPKTTRLISIISILAIFIAVIYLIFYLISNRNMGNLGNSADSIEISDTANPTQLDERKLENCIVISYDNIIIDNEVVDIEYVKEYINERRLSNTTITIVDDYSLSSKYHEVLDLCHDITVEQIDYEKWNQN